MSYKQGDVRRNTACHFPTNIEPFPVGKLYIGELLPVRSNAHGCKILSTANVCKRHSGIGVATFTLNKGGSTQISTELISASLYITRLFICVVF